MIAKALTLFGVTWAGMTMMVLPAKAAGITERIDYVSFRNFGAPILSIDPVPSKSKVVIQLVRPEWWDIALTQSSSMSESIPDETAEKVSNAVIIFDSALCEALEEDRQVIDCGTWRDPSSKSVAELRLMTKEGKEIVRNVNGNFSVSKVIRQSVVGQSFHYDAGFYFYSDDESRLSFTGAKDHIGMRPEFSWD